VSDTWQALFARRTLGVRLGLEIVEGAHAAMGRPGRGIPTIHVVGTNGKGSTAALAEHVLRGRGWRTGLYTSPHLHRVGERVRVGGQPVDDARLRAHVEAVLRVEAGLGLPRPLSFFELLTLAALDLLAAAGVEALVVEAGLGGRLDATRVCEPRVVAVASIDLDHTAILGETIAAITAEKAAVMRPGVPTVSAPQHPAAEAGLRARAAEVGCPLQVVEPLPRAPRGLPGAHQRINGALALAAVRALVPDATPAELDGVRWPGRLEPVSAGGGTLVLDVAHNPAGVAVVAAAVAAGEVPRPDLVVVGCQADKDAAGIVAALAPVPGPRVWVSVGEGSCAPAGGAWAARHAGPDDPAFIAALAAALAAGAVVLVLGSHPLVGAVRALALGEGSPADPQDPRAVPPRAADHGGGR
jgi:dihydrofolate synthase / folylpolyglutamate synthase